jgi:hypothetical protein
MADATKTEDEYFREHEHHFEAETQRWRAAQTIEQVGGFFADWFDGKSRFLPSYLSPQPGPETTQAPGFTTLLSRLNRTGWLRTVRPAR